MAGVAGIFQRDQQPCDSGLLRAMHACLRHRGEDFHDLWVSGHVGLAANGRRIYPESAIEIQPRVDRAAGVAVVFDGRLDNRSDVLRIGGAVLSTPKDAPDVDLVLAVFKEKKGAFAQYLLGDFACAAYDAKSDSIYLTRDAIGVRPLYYRLHQGALIFGSEIRCLVVPGLSKPRPDYDVLSQFLLQRSLPPGDDRSFFADIKSVRPGHVLEVTHARVVDRMFWDFDSTKEIRYSSYPEYVEEFTYRLENSLHRRLRSTSVVGISLSGGLDSSSLFCMAKRMNEEKRRATMGVIGAYMNHGVDNPADEIAHIDAIEKQYQIAVARIDAEELGYFSHGLEPARQSETPFADVGWGTAQKLREHFARHGARVVLTGHWGDQVLFEQRYLLDLLRSLELKTLVRHLTQFGRWYQDADSAYFRRQFYRDALRFLLPDPILKAAKAILGRGNRFRGRQIYTDGFVNRALNLRAATGGTAGDRTEHASALYEQVRSRPYQIALDVTNKVANHSGLEFAYPYLDRDLVEFLMAVPGHVVTRNGIPKALLRDAAANCLPESVRNRNWKADTTFIEYAALREQLPKIQEYLSMTLAVYNHRISSPTKVAQALAGTNTATGRGEDIDWSLEYFLGACQWLDAFDFETEPGVGLER